MHFNSPKKNQLKPSYFKDIKIGSVFIGKFRGFKPTKKYWIGICDLFDSKKQLNTKDPINASVQFVISKASENSIASLIELKKMNCDKNLKLIFRGMTKSGQPIFFHEFV